MAADIAIPKLTYQHEHQKHYVPWWNSRCTEVIKEKRHLLRRYQKTRTEDNKLKLHIATKKVHATCLQAKKQYWETFISEEINNPDDLIKTWTKLRQMRRVVSTSYVLYSLKWYNKSLGLF